MALTPFVPYYARIPKYQILLLHDLVFTKTMADEFILVLTDALTDIEILGKSVRSVCVMFFLNSWGVFAMLSPYPRQ